jgi:hypothetical protein
MVSVLPLWEFRCDETRHPLHQHSETSSSEKARDEGTTDTTRRSRKNHKRTETPPFSGTAFLQGVYPTCLRPQGEYKRIKVGRGL